MQQQYVSLSVKYLLTILDDFPNFRLVKTEEDAGRALEDPPGPLDQLRSAHDKKTS